MRKRFILFAILIVALFFFSCSNSSDNLFIPPEVDDTVLFSDAELTEALTSASSITLSDGTWLYTANIVMYNGTSTPLMGKSYMTLQVSDNGTKYRATAFRLKFTKERPPEVSDAEVQEALDDMKNATWFEGLYVKGADVYMDGNTMVIEKTFTSDEVNMVYPAAEDTQYLNTLFYVEHNSTVFTNSERTKYKISCVEGSDTATVYILKQ